MKIITRHLNITTMALLTLALLPACTVTKEQAQNLPHDHEARITVHNYNVLDVTIYAHRGAERIRLGMITSGNSKVFVLKDQDVVNAPLIQFVADPIGSAQTVLIDELTVFPGSALELWVPIGRL